MCWCGVWCSAGDDIPKLEDFESEVGLPCWIGVEKVEYGEIYVSSGRLWVGGARCMIVRLVWGPAAPDRTSCRFGARSWSDGAKLMDLVCARAARPALGFSLQGSSSSSSL